jgi:hypothetical protein
LGGDAFDRDTLPGSGSTDLQFHAYRRAGPRRAQLLCRTVQFAVASQDGYRPGNEFDVGGGADLRHGAERAGAVLALLGSVRARDTGVNSDTDNTGYSRC